MENERALKTEAKEKDLLDDQNLFDQYPFPQMIEELGPELAEWFPPDMEWIASEGRRLLPTGLPLLLLLMAVVRSSNDWGNIEVYNRDWNSVLTKKAIAALLPTYQYKTRAAKVADRIKSVIEKYPHLGSYIVSHVRPSLKSRTGEYDEKGRLLSEEKGNPAPTYVKYAKSISRDIFPVPGYSEAPDVAAAISPTGNWKLGEIFRLVSSKKSGAMS